MRTLIAAGFTLFALGLSSCATVPPPLEIDGSADGSRVTLAPGQELRIVVDDNPASGYRWMIDRGATGVLQLVGQPIYTPTSLGAPLVGAGGTMTFDFRADAVGSDTLQLAYRRLSQRASAPARNLRVEVVVR